MLEAPAFEGRFIMTKPHKAKSPAGPINLGERVRIESCAEPEMVGRHGQVHGFAAPAGQDSVLVTTDQGCTVCVAAGDVAREEKPPAASVVNDVSCMYAPPHMLRILAQTVRLLANARQDVALADSSMEADSATATVQRLEAEVVRHQDHWRHWSDQYPDDAQAVMSAWLKRGGEPLEDAVLNEDDRRPLTGGAADG